MTKVIQAFRNGLLGFAEAVFNIVLTFFESMNKRIRSKLPHWKMEEETMEHVHMLLKILKLVILPASMFYVCADFFLFRENAVDSMLWGLAAFCYSSFLPDLPSIFRKTNGNKKEDAPWYKKYSILLLAPIFIWLLFSGIRLGWKTSETFHNFKSVAIFAGFLFLCSFLAFGEFPVGVGNFTEILSLPLYGMVGYLSHLKVDKIW